MRQAPMTAQMYLMEAIECIDKAFGQGYAKDNPDLVAAFIRVSGQDFTAAILAQTIAEAAEELARAVNDASANFSA